MPVIGITGQFASGKSSIAKILARLCKAEIIDADKAGHAALRDKNVKESLTKYFGKGILTKGAINRRALAKKAFSGAKSHKALCKITHPLLIRNITGRLKQIESKSPGRAVIIDAAVLIEMGLDKYVDKLIVVKISRKEQERRARVKWGLSRKEIKKRIKLQFPASRLFKKADFIIDNSSSLENTKRQIENLRSKIWNMSV